MIDIFLNKTDRREIYKTLSNAKVFEEMQKLRTLVRFLDSIWDLHNSPSDDYRFNTLYQSFNKHLIDNYDYDIDEVILDRLGLLKDENGETFKKFIIALLDSSFYEDDGIIDNELYTNVLSQLKNTLKPLGWEFVVFSYDEDGKIRYKLQEITLAHTNSIPSNKIPILFTTSFCNSSNNYNHNKPEQGEVFLLVFDRGWDDFGVATKATLFYYDKAIRCNKIGDVKILYTDDATEKMSATDRYSIEDYIKESMFMSLDTNFCSLGQELVYYANLQRLFGENDEWMSVLLAMRDAAYFSSIYDQFSNAPQWHSLIREKAAQNILQVARPMLHGVDLDDMYNFSYRFVPPYSQDEDEVMVHFVFDNPVTQEGAWDDNEVDTNILSRRVYGIIGKNGVGKTHFLTSIPTDIATGHLTSFSGQIPLFRKVITVSNSYYDHFDIPEPSLNFNYVYCGHMKLSKDGDRGKKLLKSRDEFILEILQNGKKITSLLKCELLKKLLIDLMPQDFIEECFEYGKNSRLILAEDITLKDWIEKLSSGEASLLHVLFSLVANVGSGTLILFDEPETHLHPNAITSLFNSLQQLCEDTNSYAIIATHSPLVIREIRSECVFVFTRTDNSCSVSKINYESFGASIDHLTEDIFGNREVPKSYLRIIKDLINNCDKTEEEVIEVLKNGDLPLGLGVRLYIRQLINQNNNA